MQVNADALRAVFRGSDAHEAAHDVDVGSRGVKALNEIFPVGILGRLALHLGRQSGLVFLRRKPENRDPTLRDCIKVVISNFRRNFRAFVFLAAAAVRGKDSHICFNVASLNSFDNSFTQKYRGFIKD